MHKGWKFHHVAVIVKDMKNASEFYKTMEIGPFPPLLGPEGIPLTWKTVNGKASDYVVDLRHATGGIGNLAFEIIQPLKGDTPVKDFLDKKGEGIHHIGFTVDDLEKETKAMAQRGYKMIQTGEFPAAKWAYYGTDAVGGVIIELIQVKQG